MARRDLPPRWPTHCSHAARGGNVAMITALVLLPICALIGGMIDLSRAQSGKAAAQAALDAAVLAVALEQVGSDLEDTTPVDLTVTATEAFSAQTAGKRFSLTQLSVVRVGDVLTGEAIVSTESYFLGMIGIPSMQTRQTSEVKLGEHAFEIALVLDTTGSMDGAKLSDMKAAANHMIDAMSARVNDTSKLKFALVPFSNFVNVGPGMRGQSFMDGSGAASYHHEYFSEAVERFALYDHLGIDWPGCVETRPQPYDVTDERPRLVVPDTLFVPAFHPDEPDDPAAFPNTYLTDTGLGPGPLGEVRNVAKFGVQPGPWAPVSVQRTPYPFFANYLQDQGPDFTCNTQPIVPLSNSYPSLKFAINGLAAKGGTNLVEGVTWGWRVLSSEVPFTQGRAEATPNLSKAIVLLTDGNNGINGFPTDLGSEYFSYGYVENGRLGLAPGASTADINAALDARFTQACTNIKAAGVTIFVIRLEMADLKSEALLRGCASSPAHYLNVPDSAQLDAAFESVREKLTLLYLSR